MSDDPIPLGRVATQLLDLIERTIGKDGSGPATPPQTAAHGARVH